MNQTAAGEKVIEALAIIGKVWAEFVPARTPRMADAVSLLERGEAKLRRENCP